MICSAFFPSWPTAWKTSGRMQSLRLGGTRTGRDVISLLHYAVIPQGGQHV
jgi:hypothetical protein